MKKSILTLGNVLAKDLQKQINGGKMLCSTTGDCPEGFCCYGVSCIFLSHPLCH